MNSASVDEARALLARLGARPALLRHAELVGEAADALLRQLARTRVRVESDFVRVGVALHDAGKVVFPQELDGPGADHEPGGERLLLEHGVTPALARVCLSHARWATMDVSLEELLVALADKLWKGVRHPVLGGRVIDEVARRLGKSRWDLFIGLDSGFEEIAASGADRLERSRVG